jgi:hypothetical protein
MNDGEVVKAELLAVGTPYQLTLGKIHNLLADAFIQSHGDVTGPEVVAAVGATLI